MAPGLRLSEVPGHRAACRLHRRRTAASTWPGSSAPRASTGFEQIARTGLGNNSARSELIARTEAGRAINSAALQCYRDNGVQYKHLLLSPGACDICKDAAEDGDIPLDAPFSSGGVLGLSHPADRCCPGPSWIDVEPPLADLGKASGDSRGRVPRSGGCCCAPATRTGNGGSCSSSAPDGTWGMPGGSRHVGEDPWAAAVRESTEEIGDLPPPRHHRQPFHHVEDDGKTQVFLCLCDGPVLPAAR